ncbi:MAG: aspartate aminotransferase family protein [Vicinamibacterales bacterium]
MDVSHAGRSPHDEYPLEGPSLHLNPRERQDVWKQVGDAIESFTADLPRLRISPSGTPDQVRALLAGIDFRRPMAPADAVAFVVGGLRDHQVHCGHPSYFGLFNPAAATMGVAADALVAAFNPQLAAWSHAPFPCEVEELMTRELAARIGYGPGAGGSFTAGGAESNHMAVLMALRHAFPTFREHGVRSLPGQPTLYVSPEGHHSVVKAARFCGLGDASVRTVTTDEHGRARPAALAQQVESDRQRGDLPFLVVATAGTTSAGFIDPIRGLADVATRTHLWLHTDAAWAGAAALVPDLKPHFDGLERSDSLSIDAHKWLSVPMAAGVFLTRHRDLMESAFGVDATYMPVSSRERIVEPHRVSIQWTRRFIGLKLFLTLLVAGWEGYESMIRNMVRLGSTLRARLEARDWRVVNATPLPVVCFQNAHQGSGSPAEDARAIVERVQARGQAWVSLVELGGRILAIRACISNFRNDEHSIDVLMDELETARSQADLPPLRA